MSTIRVGDEVRAEVGRDAEGAPVVVEGVAVEVGAVLVTIERADGSRTFVHADQVQTLLPPTEELLLDAEDD